MFNPPLATSVQASSKHYVSGNLLIVWSSHYVYLNHEESSCTHWFIHLFSRPFIHFLIEYSLQFSPFIHSLIHPSIHPSIHSFIHSFLPSFLPSFIHSFIHSFLLKFCNIMQKESIAMKTPRPRSPGQPLTSVDPERDMPFCFNALLRRVSALLDSRQDEESTRMASDKFAAEVPWIMGDQQWEKTAPEKKSKNWFRHLQSPQVLFCQQVKSQNSPKSFLESKYWSSTRLLSLFNLPSGIPLEQRYNPQWFSNSTSDIGGINDSSQLLQALWSQQVLSRWEADPPTARVKNGDHFDFKI